LIGFDRLSSALSVGFGSGYLTSSLEIPEDTEKQGAEDKDLEQADAAPPDAATVASETKAAEEHPSE
jgi:hypothetical protein